VWGDSIGDQSGNVAVVLPANNEVVVVGGLHILGGRFGGRDWWATGSCHRGERWDICGQFSFRLSIAKFQPEESGRGGLGVLPANFL
jgi:hypothetical protein